MIKSGHSDRDVTIHLIDSGTGNKMSSIFLGQVGWPDVSRDGERMVTKGEGMLRLLDVPTGGEVARWQEDGMCSFFDHSGQRLVLVSQSGLIRLVDSRSGLEISQAALECELDGERRSAAQQGVHTGGLNHRVALG